MQYLLSENEMNDLVSKKEYDELFKIVTSKSQTIDALYEAIGEQPETVQTAIYQSYAAKVESGQISILPPPALLE